MDYESWLKRGLKNVEFNIKPNMPFKLKELFIGTEWEQLTKGERISFGRYFSMAVDEGKIPNVIKMEKAKNNHNKYQKIFEKTTIKNIVE